MTYRQWSVVSGRWIVGSARLAASGYQPTVGRRTHERHRLCQRREIVVFSALAEPVAHFFNNPRAGTNAKLVYDHVIVRATSNGSIFPQIGTKRHSLRLRNHVFWRFAS
jgi:hypothetical protein